MASARLAPGSAWCGDRGRVFAQHFGASHDHPIKRRPFWRVGQATHNRQRSVKVGQRLGQQSQPGLPLALDSAELGVGASDWIVRHGPRCMG